MAATMYYDKDADLANLQGMTVAILGYGSQGHAHAQNLRDSGINVVIAEMEGTDNYNIAVEHGFKPMSTEDAVKAGDVIVLTLPDELQGQIFRDQIRPNLSKGNILLATHGFNVHFGQFDIPEGCSAIMIAPKGPGHLVRSEFVKGGGVPCLIALGPGAGDREKAIGLAYAKGIGGTKGGVIETTFAEETETDLFGEQAVLCGGVCALMKAGFETLVEAGYAPENAYFECVHEMKLIVDLIYESGFAGMRYSISNTAEYGDYITGPKIVTDETKKAMKKILSDIQDGSFAKEWLLENQVGCPHFNAMRKNEAEQPLEKVGAELRKLYSWNDTDKLINN